MLQTESAWNENTPLLSLSHDLLCALMALYTAPFEWLLLGCVCRRLHVMLTSLRRRAAGTVLPYTHVIQRYDSAALLEWLCATQRVLLHARVMDVCMFAAEHNRRDTLRWLRERRVRWDEFTCAAAANGGHLALLQWLREPHQNAPWDSMTCERAACGAHRHVLQWLYTCVEYRDHWRASSVAESIVQHGSVALLQWFMEVLAPRADMKTTSQRLFLVAAHHGHVQVLEWLLARGYDYECDCNYNCECNYDEPSICKQAAAGGHLQVLRFAHEQQHWHWDEQVCLMAATHGQLCALQYACDNGAPVNVEWTCKEAIKAGQVDTLRYVCERYAYVPDAETCALAAKGNHIAVLRYLHGERHAPWDERVCQWALRTRSMCALQYALEHDAPCSANMRRRCLALIRRADTAAKSI